MSRHFRISLRSFIFLLLSLCVSVPVLSYGYSRSLRVESEALAQIDLSNKHATERNAEHIETLISSRIEVMQALAGTLATMDVWTPTQLQQLARATVDSVDAVQYLTIADASGVSIVFYPSRAPGHLAGVSYNDRAYIQRLRATNEPVVSKVIIGRSSKVAQIAIAAPIMTSSGEFRGFVTATVPIATLVEEIMDTRDAALQQRILVLDAASQVLADTDDATLASLLSVADAPFLTMTEPAHSAGTAEARDELGNTVRRARLPITFPGAPWSIWSMVPQRTVDATLARERDSVLRSTGVAIIVSFIFVMLLSRAITSRVRELKQFAINIGHGRLDLRFGEAPFWLPAELELLRAASNSTLTDLESSVAERESLLREIAENSEAMKPLVAAWDHVGDAIEFTDPTGRILFENPSAKTRRLSAPPSEERVSRLFTASESVKRMMTDLRAGAAWRGSISYEGSAGNHIHEDVTASPILTEEGALVRIIIIWKDVSGAIFQQERANRNERLVALGTMAATVAHEINNPLTYVRGNIYEVREQLEAASYPSSGDMLECLDDALEGADRVAMIVSRMLRLVRREEARDARCDLDVVVRSAVDVTGNALKHRASLTVELHNSGWVRMAESSLFQVLVNLLNNAAQAIPLSSSETHEIKISARRVDQWVELSVSDTGTGMSAAQIKNAFDPFFTTKQIGEGTGLGLPLAKSMVEGAGGTITVKSTPRVGTTLFIRLKTALAPRAEDAPKTAPSDPSTPTSRAPIKGRILIVDDEDAVARAISRMLGEHETEVCTSAAKALELLARIRFDVVLSDVMMPQLNGVELYQRAVAQDPALHDRWVFMSGGMFGGETAGMVKQTGCMLIEKPINSGQLKEAIQQRLAPSTGRLH